MARSPIRIWQIDTDDGPVIFTKQGLESMNVTPEQLKQNPDVIEHTINLVPKLTKEVEDLVKADSQSLDPETGLMKTDWDGKHPWAVVEHYVKDWTFKDDDGEPIEPTGDGYEQLDITLRPVVYDQILRKLQPNIQVNGPDFFTKKLGIKLS